MTPYRAVPAATAWFLAKALGLHWPDVTAP